jgi:hypothetical protein
MRIFARPHGEPTVRRSPLTLDAFVDARIVAGFEGGRVYAAEREGKFYLIQDESSLADLLSDEDLRDLATELVKVFEFGSAGERDTFIRQRGWGVQVERHRRQGGA